MKKTFWLILIFVFQALPLRCVWAGESGPGNGTDYVKVLFAEAQFSINSSLVGVGDEDLDSLGLTMKTKSWLLQIVDNRSRFSKLKFYLRTMELQFQTAPCTDGSGQYASICFFRDPAPFVLISLQENKMTTQEQAIAMLIHEAGHLTGETDHLWLDQIGVELEKAVRTPQYLIVDLQSVDVVGNIFQAKTDCEQGISDSAQILRKKAVSELERQCSEKNLKCDFSKTDFIFQGSNDFENGQGFSMKVTCAVRAVLHLR